jgi:hypothetical protein
MHQDAVRAIVGEHGALCQAQGEGPVRNSRQFEIKKKSKENCNVSMDAK